DDRTPKVVRMCLAGAAADGGPSVVGGSGVAVVAADDGHGRRVGLAASRATLDNRLPITGDTDGAHGGGFGDGEERDDQEQDKWQAESARETRRCHDALQCIWPV